MGRVTARQRRREKSIEKFVEFCVGVGALLGLLDALSYATHHVPPACTKAELRAGTCVNRTIQDTMTPYITHTFTGALIGLLLAATLVLAWKLVRTS